MKIGRNDVLMLLVVIAFCASADGCKKAEENRLTTNPASSGVMGSTTTGPNGVAGEGSTASKADADASATASEAVPQSQAPVATTPSTSASAAPAGASQ